MQAEKLSEILKSVCGDRASARALLGNSTFLEVCKLLVEGFDEQFQLIALLDRAARAPSEHRNWLESKSRGEVGRYLEQTREVAQLFREINEKGPRFCEGNSEKHSGRTSNIDWNNQKMNLIIASVREAEDAARDLTRWLKGAELFTICDPYIMHFSVGAGRKKTIFASVEDYVKFICNLVPSSARHVKFFGLGYTNKIKSLIKTKLKEGRSVEIFDNPLIHDRYIIRNNSEGRMIGTSFGGFGSKIFTVLPLPREDVSKLLRFLHIFEQRRQIEQSN